MEYVSTSITSTLYVSFLFLNHEYLLSQINVITPAAPNGGVTVPTRIGVDTKLNYKTYYIVLYYIIYHILLCYYIIYIIYYIINHDILSLSYYFVGITDNGASVKDVCIQHTSFYQYLQRSLYDSRLELMA